MMDKAFQEMVQQVLSLYFIFNATPINILNYI